MCRALPPYAVESRGFSPCGYPHKPLVSFRINRQLSGWNLPPLIIRAFGAHCHLPTLCNVQGSLTSGELGFLFQPADISCFSFKHVIALNAGGAKYRPPRQDLSPRATCLQCLVGNVVFNLVNDFLIHGIRALDVDW